MASLHADVCSQVCGKYELNLLAWCRDADGEPHDSDGRLVCGAVSCITTIAGGPAQGAGVRHRDQLQREQQGKYSLSYYLLGVLERQVLPPAVSASSQILQCSCQWMWLGEGLECGKTWLSTGGPESCREVSSSGKALPLLTCSYSQCFPRVSGALDMVLEHSTARQTCAPAAQAFLIEHDANAVEFMGNRTECALLMLLRAWGLRYEAVRNEHRAEVFQVYNFSSERKMGSVLLRQGDGGALRLYNKVRCPAARITMVHGNICGVPCAAELWPCIPSWLETALCRSIGHDKAQDLRMCRNHLGLMLRTQGEAVHVTCDPYKHLQCPGCYRNCAERCASMMDGY